MSETAVAKIKQLPNTDGANSWRVLAKWFPARSDADSSALMALIMRPATAATLSDLHDKLQQWDDWVREDEIKFGDEEPIGNKVKATAMRLMFTDEVLTHRIVGNNVKGY